MTCTQIWKGADRSVTSRANFWVVPLHTRLATAPAGPAWGARLLCSGSWRHELPHVGCHAASRSWTKARWWSSWKCSWSNDARKVDTLSIDTRSFGGKGFRNALFATCKLLQVSKPYRSSSTKATRVHRIYTFDHTLCTVTSLTRAPKNLHTIL